MNEIQKKYVSILKDAWNQVLQRYQTGSIIIKLEKNLEKFLEDTCRSLMMDRGIPVLLGTREYFEGKKVDLRLGPRDSPILVELKFYHDKADWKETRTMKNTVESDLKFIKGHENIYVGLIDVIPSTPRSKLPFRFDWVNIELDKQVFLEYYENINPVSSPPCERLQKSLLVSGNQI